MTTKTLVGVDRLKVGAKEASMQAFGVLRLAARHPALRIGLDPCLHVLLVVLALVFTKLYSLEVVSRTYLACEWCLSSKSVPHETEFLLILLALHLLSCVSRWAFLRRVFRGLAVAAIVLTALDLLVSHQFWVRLTASELFEFMGESSAIVNYLEQSLPSIWAKLAAACAGAVLAIVFVRYVLDKRPRLPPIFLYLLIGFGVAGCELVQTKEYHDSFLQNSLQVFFSPQTSTVPYSKEFANTINAQPPAAKTCHAGSAEPSDIILVVFESLSMYHSALYSGLHDWMPEFDALSRTGVRYPNFYANGVTSEQGLVSLLTGEPPIAKAMTSKTLFEQFHDTKETVPRMLHSLGYRSSFLTTGNLGFMGKGQWLKDIGFDETEGHDAPFYAGMKRYNFDAAPDDALYARALNRWEEPHTHPVFMALETVTTHLPNIDPETGAHSQEATYRYADRQLGLFVRQLRSKGFFKNGTLIITADHRAMVPMSVEERALYGDRGFVRVPMTVIGTGLTPRVETASFSQTDLLTSLRNAAAPGVQCVAADQGVFLPTAVHAPQCIFTNRSYNSNAVYAHCGSRDFTLELNGDKTQFVDAQQPPPELLATLNGLRLGKSFQ